MMAFEFNDLKGLLLLVFFTIPLAKSTNINCNAKPFHCLNSTHFMICVDLGSGVSVTIDDFIIPCPSKTVCDENNKYECEFPKIELTPAPLHVIGVSANDAFSSIDDKIMSPEIEVSTILPSIENNGVVMPIQGEITLPSNTETVESLKEEYTDGNEKFFDEDPIIPTSTLRYDIKVASTVSNEIDITSATNVNHIIQPTTENSNNNTYEMFVTDHLKSIDTTTISNAENAENLQIVNIKHLLKDTPLDLLSKTITPLKKIQHTVELDKPPDSIISSSKTDNNTSFQNNLITSKIELDVVEDSVVTTENALSIITNEAVPLMIVYNSKINDTNIITEGKLLPNTEIPQKAHQFNEVFISSQPITEKSKTTVPITTRTPQLLETTEVKLRTLSASHLLEDTTNSRTSESNVKPTLSTLIEHTENNHNLFSTDNAIKQGTKSFLLSADGSYLNIEAKSIEFSSNSLPTVTTDNDLDTNDNTEIKISERDVNISTDVMNENLVTSNLPVATVKKEVKLIMSNNTYNNKTVFNSGPTESEIYNYNDDTTINLNEKYSNKIASTPKNVPNENMTAITDYQQISVLDMTRDSATKLIAASRTELTSASPLNTDITSNVLTTLEELTSTSTVQTKLTDEYTGGTDFFSEKDTIVPTSTESQLDNVNKVSATISSINNTTPSMYLRTYESNNVYEAVDSKVPINSDVKESIVHRMTTTGYINIKSLDTANETVTSLSQITISKSNNNTNNFEDKITGKPNYYSISQPEKQVTFTFNPTKIKTYVKELGHKNHILQTTPFETSITTEMTKVSPSKVSEIKMESIITPTDRTAERSNLKPSTETIYSSGFTTNKLNNLNIKNNTTRAENKNLNIGSVTSLNDVAKPGVPTANITLAIDQISNTNGTRQRGTVYEPNIENKMTTLNEILNLSIPEHSTKNNIKEEVISIATTSPTLNTSPKLQQTAETTLSVIVTEIINPETRIEEVFTEKYASNSESPVVRYRDTLQIELPPPTTENIETHSGNHNTEEAVFTMKQNISNLPIVIPSSKSDENDTSKFIQRVVNHENNLVTPKASDSTVEQSLQSKIFPDTLVSFGNPYIDDSRIIIEEKTNTITSLPKLRVTAVENDQTQKYNYMISSVNLAPSIKPDVYETIHSITSRKSSFSSTVAYNTHDIANNPITNRVVDPVNEFPFIIKTTKSSGYNTTQRHTFENVIFTETINNITQLYNNKSHEHVLNAFQKDSINITSDKSSSRSDREQLNQETENNTVIRTQVNLDKSFHKDNNYLFSQDKYEPSKLSFKSVSETEQPTQGVTIASVIKNKNSVHNMSISPLDKTNDISMNITLTKMLITPPNINSSPTQITTGETQTKYSKGSANISNNILVINNGYTNNSKKSDTNETKVMKIDSHKNITESQDTVDDIQTFQTFEERANLSAKHNGQKITISNINDYVATIIDTSISGSPFDCTNLTRGKYADSKDCRKFYICLGNLQPIAGTCPNGTVFSEINKQCTRNLSHCVRNNQFHCLDGGRFSDFLNDNIYYICVKHHTGFLRYKLQCQKGYYLNQTIVKCIKKQVTSSKSTSSISENSQINNDQNGESEESEKSENKKKNFECRKEGKFPFKGDCNKYFECSKNKKNEYRRKIKTCPDNEVYDKENNKCKSDESNEC